MLEFLNPQYRRFNLDYQVKQEVKTVAKMANGASPRTDIGEFHRLTNFENYATAMATFAQLMWPRVYPIVPIEGDGEVRPEKYAGSPVLARAAQSVSEAFTAHSIARSLYSWDQFERFIRLDEKTETKHSLRTAALYKVIEMGGNRVGSRRGLLFAKEFDLPRAIPIAYSIDTSDPSLDDFLEQNAPSLHVLCPVNYFGRSSDWQRMEIVNLADYRKATAKRKRELRLLATA